MIRSIATLIKTEPVVRRLYLAFTIFRKRAFLARKSRGFLLKLCSSKPFRLLHTITVMCFILHFFLSFST